MHSKELEKREWTEDKPKQFSEIYLLSQISDGVAIPVILQKSNEFLEPLLSELYSKKYLSIVGHQYQLTENGKESLSRFHKRYHEYLSFFDFFCSVDLQQEIFAFSQYFDFSSDEAWDAYLEQENWQDIRIAVARFKHLDPHEMVFMSFLNENRFGSLEKDTWQFDLMLGSIWDDIRNICATAITEKQIGGPESLSRLITAGSKLMIELLEHENQIEQWEKKDTEVEEEEEYYEYYTDPHYISPYWIIPIFFL